MKHSTVVSRLVMPDLRFHPRGAKGDHGSDVLLPSDRISRPSWHALLLYFGKHRLSAAQGGKKKEVYCFRVASRRVESSLRRIGNLYSENIESRFG